MSYKLIGKSVFVFCLSLSLATLSNAHFIWATLDRSTRTVELQMAERPGLEVLDYADRLRPTIHLLSQGGKEVQGDKAHLRFDVAASSSLALVRIDYGTFNRGSEIWNLTYFSKAALTAQDANRVVGKGLEIVAKLVGDQWELTPYLDGKPCKTATIVLDDEEAAKTTELGKTRVIPVSADKPIAVRATISDPTPGVRKGTAFVGTKIWSTLVLPKAPVVTDGSEPRAYRAVQQATEARESISRGSKPWEMHYKATNGKEEVAGRVVWNGSSFDISGDDKNPNWKHIKTEISSLFFHRLTSDFANGEGKATITEARDSQGTLYRIADKMDSSYRIANGRFTEVARTVGGKRLVLSITGFKEVPGGRVLSTAYSSVVTDLKTKSEIATLHYSDRFRHFGTEWLPVSRTVEGVTGGHKIKMVGVFGQPKTIKLSATN